MNRTSWLLITIVLLVGCGVLLFILRGASPPRAAVRPAEATDEPEKRISENVHGYVGWQACAECHRQRVEEFQQTRHFQAITLPNEMAFPTDLIKGHDAFSPLGSPARFELVKTAEGAALLTSLANAANAGHTQSSIAFVYGSGAGTDEVYFTRRGDRLFELPVVWLPESQQWGSSSINPHSSGDFSRPLTPQCLECHNTWVDYHRGTLNEYGPFEPHLMRVTCERCHGPANAHVEHHRSQPGDKVATSILQPKLFSRERLMDVCAQCHSNTVRYRQAPFSYRAGEPLDEYFLTLQMKYPEEDRVANQTRYLKESRCYQQSETLTCVTCHDPHRVRDTKDPFSSSRCCAKCHDRQSCTAQARLPDQVRENCAGCHMPVRNKVQVHFETADGEIVFPAPRAEHRIGIYPDAEWDLTLQALPERSDGETTTDRTRLRDQLVQYWTGIGDSALTEYRFVRAIDGYRNAFKYHERADLKSKISEVTDLYRRARSFQFEGLHAKQTGQLQQATSQFELLLAINPNSATAHYELGTLSAATDKRDQASASLKRASELDPTDPAPHAMLGWLDLLAKRPADAYRHYLDAESVDPWNDSIEYMLVQCLIQMGQYEQAISACERVIEINPRHRDAVHTFRGLVRERSDSQAALEKVLAVAQTTQRQQPELLLLLAEIRRDLNQNEESLRLLVESRRLAESKQPALLPQIDAVRRQISQTDAPAATRSH